MNFKSIVSGLGKVTAGVILILHGSIEAGAALIVSGVMSAFYNQKESKK